MFPHLQVSSRRPSGRSLQAALPTSPTRLCATAWAWRSSTGSQRRWTRCCSTGRRADGCPRWPSSKWPGWTRKSKSWASERPMRDCSPWPPLNCLFSRWITISFGTFPLLRSFHKVQESVSCANVAYEINILINTYMYCYAWIIL